MCDTPRSRRTFQLQWPATLLFLALPLALHAQVKATLDPPVLRTGVPGQLVFRVAASEPPQMPATIAASGLEIRLAVTHRRDGWVSGLTKRSGFRFNYTVTADRPGRFVIPSFRVAAGSRSLLTKPITVRVAGSSPASPAGPTKGPPPFPSPTPLPRALREPDTRAAPAPDYFASPPEFETTRAFVGQMIRVELRYYLRSDSFFESPLRQPILSGEGLSVLPLREAPATTEVIDGVLYNVLTFLTSVIPAKPGRLMLRPPALTGRYIPAGGGTLRRFASAAESAPDLTIRELPEEGRPADFTGGVGEFTAEPAEVDPAEAPVGQPLAWRLHVSGDGNLEALRPPRLGADNQWRVYEPKEIFQPGLAPSYGRKTFDYRIVAKQAATRTPSASFAYFNPTLERYMRVEFAAVPVRLDAPSLDGNAASTPPPPPPDLDVVYSKSGLIAALQSMWPQGPMLPQLLVVFLLLLCLALLLRKIRKSHRVASARQRLEAEFRTACGEWEPGDQDPARFYDRAARIILARLSLQARQPVSAHEADSALSRHVMDADQRQKLAAILSRRDELQYGGQKDTHFSQGERETVVRLLQDLCQEPNGGHPSAGLI